MPIQNQLTHRSCRAVSKLRAVLVAFIAAFVSTAFAEEKLVSITNDIEFETAHDDSGNLITNRVTSFHVHNLQSGDVTVTLEAKLKNYASEIPLPCTLTIPANANVEAFRIHTVDPNADSKWSYTYFATWGSLTAKHDDTVVYALPFAPGASYAVSQGFHGAFSHTGGDSFAIDFKMDLGTPVHAARDGVVVGVKDDSIIGGPEKKFEWEANYIHIRHADGTIAQYVHLQKGTARVKVGDPIQAGQWIGCSGNTGHTTGPHLHFAVFKAADGKNRQTIPVRFKANGLIAQTLQEGATYRAL